MKWIAITIQTVRMHYLNSLGIEVYICRYLIYSMILLFGMSVAILKLATIEIWVLYINQWNAGLRDWNSCLKWFRFCSYLFYISNIWSNFNINWLRSYTIFIVYFILILFICIYLSNTLKQHLVLTFQMILFSL